MYFYTRSMNFFGIIDWNVYQAIFIEEKRRGLMRYSNPSALSRYLTKWWSVKWAGRRYPPWVLGNPRLRQSSSESDAIVSRYESRRKHFTTTSFSMRRGSYLKWFPLCCSTFPQGTAEEGTSRCSSDTGLSESDSETGRLVPCFQLHRQRWP